MHPIIINSPDFIPWRLVRLWGGRPLFRCSWGGRIRFRCAARGQWFRFRYERATRGRGTRGDGLATWPVKEGTWKQKHLKEQSHSVHTCRFWILLIIKKFKILKSLSFALVENYRVFTGLLFCFQESRVYHLFPAVFRIRFRVRRLRIWIHAKI